MKEEIYEEKYDGMPRIVEINGKHFIQDFFRVSEFPIEESKIYNLSDEELPEKIWDNVEYIPYYQQKGYDVEEGGDINTDNERNMLYQKIKKAKFCVDCQKQLTEFDLQRVKEGNRCIKCKAPIWTKEKKELKDKAEKIGIDLSKNNEFIKLPNIQTKRAWVELKFPNLKSRSSMIVRRADSLIPLELS